MKNSLLFWALLCLCSLHSEAASTKKIIKQTLPLNVGTAVSGVITTPAEMDRFTFSGSRGERLYFDALDLDNEGIFYTIQAPSGAIVRQDFQGNDSAPFYLLETGVYTVTLESNSDQTGDYKFDLRNLGNVTTWNLGQATVGRLDPSASTQVYRHEGVAGERLNFESLSSPELSGVSWRFFGPANQELAGGTMAGNLGEVFLPTTGSYVILVQGLVEGAPIDYSFRISRVSSPSGTATGFGTRRTGNVDGSTTANFNYTAPAGLVVYFDTLENDGDAANVELLDPDGVPVFLVNASSDSGPHTLTKSGNYTLQVRSSDGVSAGDYDFKLTNLSSGSPLAFGSDQTLTLQPFEQLFLPLGFQAASSLGQIVLFDSLEVDGQAVSFGFVTPRFFTFGGTGSTDNDSNPVQFTEPGTHWLLISNFGDAEADAVFRLVDAAAFPLSLDAPLNTTITLHLTPGRLARIYRVNGLVAGQRLYFDALGENTGANWTVFSPTQRPYGGQNITTDFEFPVTESGNHLLVLNGTSDDPVPYSFRIITAQSSTSPLNIGGVTTGALSEAGEEHRFTFMVNGGEQFFYDAIDSDFDAINVRLLDPSGSIAVLPGNNSDVDVGPFFLNSPGIYTLIVGGNTSVLGDYKFRLIDLAQLPALPVSFDTTISRTLDPATQADLLTFQGTAGQWLFFDGNPVNSSGVWTLYGPNNQFLGQAGLGSDFPVLLPANGRYLVTVSSSPSDAVPYSVRIVTPPNTTTPLSLGTVVTGNLSEPGERHRFTFAGVQGQRIFYDGLDNDRDDIRASLFGPTSQSATYTVNSDDDVLSVVLQENGTHTISVGGETEVIGDYKFRVLDLANATPLVLGTSRIGRLDPANSILIYSFQSPGGQVVELESLSSSSTSANWTVYDTLNSGFKNGNIADKVENILLTTPGTYTFVLVGGDNPDPIDFEFRLNLVTGGGNNDFSGIRQGTLGAGEVLSTSFNAVAGTIFYFDALMPNSPVSVQILDPNGSSIFDGNSSSEVAPIRLNVTGQYTLNIRGEGGGDYQFDLINLSEGEMISAGDIISGQLDANRTKAFRLDATQLEKLFFDGRLGGTEPVDAYLVSPNGTALFGSGFFFFASIYSDHYMASVNETGTHFLLVRSFHPDAANYSFRILNSGRAPTQELPLDTAIGGALSVVPASALNVVGSYINGSLRDRPDKDDWRQTQTIAGTRNDDPINFPSDGWGSLASVGLQSNDSGGQNGSDENWENFSVQWDGSVSITKAGTRLYTRSDDGSRMWIDTVADSIFEDSELTDNNWGSGQGATLGGGSAPLAVGSYSLRIQYEEGNSQNSMELLMDTGVSLAPREALLYRFTANAGQRLVFDSLEPSAFSANWVLHAPQGPITSGGLNQDQEVGVLSQTGTYLLFLANPTDRAVAFGFRITTPETIAFPFQLGVDITGTLVEADQRHRFVFEGRAGQRLYYDAMQSDFQPVQVYLYEPDGGQLMSNNADADASLLLLENGTYTLEFDDNSLSGGQTYAFRLLDVATVAQAIASDETASGELLNGRAALFRYSTLRGLKLYFDGLGADGPNNWSVYNSANTHLVLSSTASDFELNSDRAEDLLVIVNATDVTQTSNYSFRIIPANHPPFFADIGLRTIQEEAVFNFTPQVSDNELPNDVLKFALDPGAPAGLTVNPATGALSWTPTEAQGKGDYVVTLVVTDDGQPSLSYSETFTFHVDEVNRPPVLQPIADISVNEGSPVRFTAVATDPDIPANSLQFELDNAPEGASIHPLTGEFNWTPGEADGPR
ncbi:MAG: putative Ig domain-containing protein, partial [Verrucomicrobiota bacterium]